MTPPTPAAALAAALHDAVCEMAFDKVTNTYYEDHSADVDGTDNCGTAGSILAALAASGWQVTRQDEGLRAALNLLTSVEPNLDLDSAIRVREFVERAMQEEQQARAALASGEEGQ